MSGALTSISRSPPSSLPLPELELAGRLRAVLGSSTTGAMRLYGRTVATALAMTSYEVGSGWSHWVRSGPRVQPAC